MLYLKKWYSSNSRRPLVIRGARQVGKSFLVRMFAKEQFDNLAEVNFELSPNLVSLFESRSPRTILPLLETVLKTKIVPGRTLLFLDEMQAAPMVFAALRYFHEHMPELHIAAAGSLLDFVLKDHSFAMPVGRIEYLHLGPMCFEEFLSAMGAGRLEQWFEQYKVGTPVPAALHAEGIELVKQYCICGGMPAAVRAWSDDPSGQECAAVQQSILATFRQDFGKYSGRVRHSWIQKIFNAVPRLTGRKFMYSHVDREERSRDLKKAFELLCLARVIHPVYHSHANGIPVGAEIEESVFKALFLDVGLVCRSLGLGVLDVAEAGELLLVNSGAVCEQFIGQELLGSHPPYEDPALYCWMRQKHQSNAEVDYVLNLGETIVPVEVKAGKTGTLKSLHLFLREKQRTFGLRFNSDQPSLFHGRTSLADGDNKEFTLLSLPFYLAGQSQRLCRETLAAEK